jgi:hypothetical protein
MPRGRGVRQANELAETDFRVKDYEMKVDYLVSQFGRMWNRFQFFLGIETLLVGLFFAPLQSSRMTSATTFAVIGLLSSLFWFGVGAEDKYLVGLYRDQVRMAATHVRHLFHLEDDYNFVGQTDVRGRRAFVSPIEWRVRDVSITTLVAVFPAVTLIGWLILLAYAR